MVERQGAVLGGQLEQGCRVAHLGLLALGRVAKAAGIHLEDDQVLERDVGQLLGGGLDLTGWLCRAGEKRAQHLGCDADLEG